VCDAFVLLLSKTATLENSAQLTFRFPPVSFWASQFYLWSKGSCQWNSLFLTLGWIVEGATLAINILMPLISRKVNFVCFFSAALYRLNIGLFSKCEVLYSVRKIIVGPQSVFGKGGQYEVFFYYDKIDLTSI
jgi:hypothetical protein